VCEKGDQKKNVKAKKMFVVADETGWACAGGERMKKETRKRKLKASPKKRAPAEDGLERLIKHELSRRT
jgi:hypothetical protein